MRYLYLLFVFVYCFTLSAQETGSFEQTVTFDESDYSATRTLYYYVPTDYDAAQAYPLVVGFRGGPHFSAGHFRNQLSFLADSIGAIILCPENSDHFWNEEDKTKQLFQYSVASAQEQYNIDPEMIYLTGLSYGGRHAVIVGLDTDAGAIPPLRGVIPFAAGTDSELKPNYAISDQFAPTCVCIGLNDSENFINISNIIHDRIQENGGISMLNEITGVGHTAAFPTYPDEMMECINFIEAQYEISTTADPGLSAQLEVFPNPASGYLQFSFPADWSVQAVELIGLNGQTLLTPQAGQPKLDVSTLPRGFYFLRVSTDNGVAVQRVVRQ